jgi:hypothetical protein
MLKKLKTQCFNQEYGLVKNHQSLKVKRNKKRQKNKKIKQKVIFQNQNGKECQKNIHHLHLIIKKK